MRIPGYTAERCLDISIYILSRSVTNRENSGKVIPQYLNPPRHVYVSPGGRGAMFGDPNATPEFVSCVMQCMADNGLGEFDQCSFACDHMRYW